MQTVRQDKKTDKRKDTSVAVPVEIIERLERLSGEVQMPSANALAKAFLHAMAQLAEVPKDKRITPDILLMFDAVRGPKPQFPQPVTAAELNDSSNSDEAHMSSVLKTEAGRIEHDRQSGLGNPQSQKPSTGKTSQ